MADAKPLKPPPTFQDLQKRIAALAKAKGVPAERLYQRVGTDVLVSAFEQGRAQGIVDYYAVKGGMALEVRFGMRARASRDLDIALPVPFDAIPDLLDRVLDVGFGDFALRRKGLLRTLERASTYRAEISIVYKRKPLFTLDVDINGVGIDVAVDVVGSDILGDLGFPGALQMRLLNIHQQLAQKLHGATQPSMDGYTNARYRDVVDCLLIEDGGSLDYDLGRIHAASLFSRRATHAWPTYLNLDDLGRPWRGGLRSEAESMKYGETDPDRLASRFNHLIALMEGVDMSDEVESKVIEVTADGVMAMTAADGEIGKMLADGWRIVTMVNDPRRVWIVLEKRRAPARMPREAPRLHTRLLMRGPNTTPGLTAVTPLEGTVINLGSPANYVRAIVPGVPQDYYIKSKTRFGTISAGDEIPISLDCHEGAMQSSIGDGPWEFAFEFEDDAGQKYRQVGAMEAYAAIDNVRLFQVNDMGPAMPIAAYSVSYKA
jgi:hypothetical protein